MTDKPDWEQKCEERIAKCYHSAMVWDQEDALGGLVRAYAREKAQAKESGLMAYRKLCHVSGELNAANAKLKTLREALELHHPNISEHCDICRAALREIANEPKTEEAADETPSTD